MKMIFDLLTSPLGLPIAWYWEYLIIWAISGIAYRVAFALVGNLYDRHLIFGSVSGSICHWIIRLVFFVLLWAMIYGIIVAVNWVVDNYILCLCILGGTTLVVLITTALIKMKG